MSSHNDLAARPGIQVNDGHGHALPFDEALRTECKAFFRLFNGLAPENRAGLEKMQEVYRTIREQEQTLSHLYMGARELCQDTTAATVEMEALQKYIPRFAKELHHHMGQVNKHMEKGSWNNVAGSVGCTKTALEMLLTKVVAMQGTLESLKKKAVSVKDSATQALGGAAGVVARRTGALVLHYAHVLVRGLIDLPFSLNTGCIRLFQNHPIIPAILMTPGIIILGGGVISTAAAVCTGISAASVAVAVLGALAGGCCGLLLGGAITGTAYGAYCLATSAARFLGHLEDYQQQRLAEIDGAMKVVRTAAEQSEKDTSALLDKLDKEKKQLETCVAELTQLESLATTFAANKENYEQMDEEAKIEEMQRCREDFNEHWQELDVPQHSEVWRCIMPHMRPMTDLFDSIEPRALKMICDDEVAALLSMTACSDGAAAQLIKLENLTITNVRRYSAPVEGSFSSFVVAEVQGPADDSLYPALFVAFKGSQDVETTTNVVVLRTGTNFRLWMVSEDLLFTKVTLQKSRRPTTFSVENSQKPSATAGSSA